MDEDTEQLDWGDVADDNAAMGDDDDAISLGGADDDLQELQKYQAAKGVDTESPTGQNAPASNFDSSLAQPTNTIPARRGSPQQMVDEKSATQRSVSPMPPSSSNARQNARRPSAKSMVTPTGPLALPPKPAAVLSETYLPPSAHSLTEASAMTVRAQRDRDREWDRNKDRDRERERVGSSSRARDDRARDERVRDDRVHEDRGRDDRGREERVRDDRIEDLPAGWKVMKSSQGSDYYFHVVTLQTQWERPVENQSTRRAHPDAYPLDPSSDFPRSNPRRYPPPPNHAEPSPPWTATARRDASHYSPEQTRLPLSRAPRSHSPQPPPPPPPMRPSRRSVSPPRAGRAVEHPNGSWRQQSSHENNDRSWRPTKEDERRWEERERDRNRERMRDRDRDMMITERDKERELAMIRGPMDHNREHTQAQVPPSKDRRARPRSPDHNARRPNGSMRNDSERSNVPLPSDATASRHRSPPSSTPTAGSTSTGQDDSRTVTSNLTSPHEPSTEHEGDKKPEALPSPASAADSDAKRRRTDSDPDSTRARRPTPDDTSYAVPANGGESPRKRKPLPPQDEVIRSAKFNKHDDSYRSAPPSTEAARQDQSISRPPPGPRDRGFTGPPNGPRDRSFENSSGIRERGDSQPRRMGSFRTDVVDDRVPSGPRAERGPPGMPTPPMAFRNRRDSVNRRNDEPDHGQLPPPGTSLQLDTGPPTQPRMNARYGLSNGEWSEPPHSHPQREIAGRPSRFNDGVTQNDRGRPAPRMTSTNDAPSVGRRPSFKQSPQTATASPLPPPNVPMGSRVDERPPPPPKLVNSQEGFYPTQSRPPPPPPTRSPHVSPVQERQLPLPQPSAPPAPQSRPPLASRMSGPEFSQREGPSQIQNDWGPRGRRSRSFRENGAREEGMQRPRSPPPPGAFEQPETAHQRFSFSERIGPPGPEHSTSGQPALTNGMHPERAMALGVPNPQLLIPHPFMQQPTQAGGRDSYARDQQRFHAAAAAAQRKSSLLERMGHRYVDRDAEPGAGGSAAVDVDVEMEDAPGAPHGGPRRRASGPRNGGGYQRRGQGRRR